MHASPWSWHCLFVCSREDVRGSSTDLYDSSRKQRSVLFVLHYIPSPYTHAFLCFSLTFKFYCCYFVLCFLHFDDLFRIYIFVIISKFFSTLYYTFKTCFFHLYCFIKLLVQDQYNWLNLWESLILFKMFNLIEMAIKNRIVCLHFNGFRCF